jgi:hypothetical protein
MQRMYVDCTSNQHTASSADLNTAAAAAGRAKNDVLAHPFRLCCRQHLMKLSGCKDVLSNVSEPCCVGFGVVLVQQQQQQQRQFLLVQHSDQASKQGLTASSNLEACWLIACSGEEQQLEQIDSPQNAAAAAAAAICTLHTA